MILIEKRINIFIFMVNIHTHKLMLFSKKSQFKCLKMTSLIFMAKAYL
jgi:hypothetical protein